MTTQQLVRKAILPVAGLGTRFLPATKAMPKEMLTVVDKPLIQYAVEEALAAGIREFIFVTGRGKGALENHFDKPYELADILKKKGKFKELDSVLNIMPADAKIYYTRQGEPKGLGHAVHCAANIIGNEPFAVLLPDDIIHEEGRVPLADMIKAFNDTQKSVVLTLEVPKDRTKNYGICDLGGAATIGTRAPVQGFVEKPSSENAPSNLAVLGRYILTPGHMNFLEKGLVGAGNEIQLTDAMNEIAQTEGFQAHIFQGERFDCGDKVGFQQANLFFALKDPYIKERLLPYVEHIVAKNKQHTEQAA